MDYKVIDRPKLARNKYGKVEDKEVVGGGNSYFSSSTTTNGGSGSGTYYKEFIGSTATQDGVKGLVPAPKTNNDEPLIDNDNQKFLKGTGAWVDIPISRYTSENTNKDGIDFDGNLTVNDTLTTNTLNVLGSAHFWELVIDKVKAAGGNLLITPASFKVDFVGDVINYNVDATQSPFNVMFYNETEGTGILGLQELFTNQNVTQLKAKRLYMKRSEDNNQIVTECQIGDMLRCKTLNLDDDGSEFSNKDYWTFVLATGSEEFQGEDCLYIDVLYQYVSNNTTYGVGTTITYQEETVDTHLTYYENDYTSNVTGQDKVIIVTTEQSSMFYAYFDSNHHGTVSWDGTKWNFDESSNSISLNGSFTYSDGGELGICECVMDRRWANPVLKMRNLEGHYVNNLFYGQGFFYAEDYIEDSGSSDEPLLDSFKFGYGDFNPEVGDDLVCLGHLWNGERQGAILISAYDPMDPELKAPAIAQYMGIRTFTSLSPYRVSNIAANGNRFMGKFLVDYNGTYIDIDEKLNIYTTDITTGLEKVGIHLDGENSTIKMVGSTEIRQNADGIVDTLTVWDSDDIMRVKVSPDTIPSKSNIQQDINPTSNVQFINSGTSNNYSIIEHHTWTEFIWSWDHRWEYYVNNSGYIKFNQYCNIGSFESGDKITLSNLTTNLTSKAYFKGGDHITSRSTSGRPQTITDVILRLMRKSGSSYVTVTSENLTSNATISVGAEDATISYISTIWNNYTIGTTGSYRLELEFVYNPYASITYSSQQSNPRIDFYNSLRSSIYIIQPSASMTRIGRNGLVFNTDNAGQYFYAGNDGIEMKWGDSSITLDSTNGLKLNSELTNITSSSSKYIPNSATVAICTTLSSDTTVYLPPVANYGIGREITVIGNDYVTVSTYSSSEYIYTFKGENSSRDSYPSKLTDTFNTSRTVSMTSTRYTTEENEGNTEYTYYRYHTPMYRFISTGSGWYLL